MRQAVGRGEFALGLVNHYYYQLEKEEGSPVGVIYPDQEDGEVGVLVNVAAASIVAGASTERMREAFMRFLLGPSAQEMFAALNFEYPLVAGVEDRADVEARHVHGVGRRPGGTRRDERSTLDMMDEVGLE